MPKNKTIQRAKNITPEIKQKIFDILDAWKGRLTWDLLIKELTRKTYQEYTRQTLHKHDDIATAFNVKKQRTHLAVEGRKKLYTSEESYESERNTRLKDENARLQAQIEMFIEKFNRWTYNSYIRGVTEDQLEQPLPKR